jgi:hypothetical protein
MEVARWTFPRRGLLAVAAVAMLAFAAPAHATVGQARTSGPQYDRNPTVVQDGALTYLFFARSATPCNRLAGCNPDSLTYDLYYKVSSNGGKDYGPPRLAALNPLTAPIFYGRTIAATRTDDGTIHLFWASGGNSTTLYHVEKLPGAPVFTPPVPVVGIASVNGTFNVEAVSVGQDIYLYTEECCAPDDTGIWAYSYAAGVASGRTLVSLNKNLPKAIVDKGPGPFRFRMTMTDASAYPTVDVYVASSVDGLTWTPPELVIHEDGVSHWNRTSPSSRTVATTSTTRPTRSKGRAASGSASRRATTSCAGRRRTSSRRASPPAPSTGTTGRRASCSGTS